MARVVPAGPTLNGLPQSSPQAINADNAQPLTCTIAQLAGDVLELLQALFLAGIIQVDAVPYRILDVRGARLLIVGHGLPHEAKIARYLSLHVLHPLFPR